MPDDLDVQDEIQKTINLRARFIDLAWIIERRVALLLTAAFTSEKKKAEMFLVFIMGHPEMTFSVKSRLLELVHEMDPLPGLDKNTFDLLKTVREFRNDLAHCVVQKGEVEGELTMMRIEKGRTVITPLKYPMMFLKVSAATALSTQLAMMVGAIPSDKLPHV